MKITNNIKFAVSTFLSLGVILFSFQFISFSKINAENSSKLIALTFDDGPNTTTTNEVLDILEEYHAYASFFLIGNNINEDSAVTVKRAYDMGCEIDNHSKTHSNMGSMDENTMLEEIEYVDNYVYEITGEYTKFFRPPYIDTSQKMYDVIDKPFICGVGCNDFMENVTAEERAETIISAAEDGLIVLLHDAQGNSQTVEALKTIIPTLQAEGYEFVTLTELFKRQGETPKETQLYSKVAKYPCTNYTIYKNIFSGEVIGDTSWNEWGSTAAFDGDELASLNDTYAIEVEYEGIYQPVIALQKWTGDPLFCSVQPSYYNGEKACFLASDLQKELDKNNVSYTDMNRICIIPYGGTMTLRNVDLLLKNSHDNIRGDVNDDGKFDVSDIVALQKYLVKAGSLKNWKAGDLCTDECINVFDFCAMKKLLINNK